MIARGCRGIAPAGKRAFSGPFSPAKTIPPNSAYSAAIRCGRSAG
ncbi:hypothetical protein roselon_00272 [Roseibacterium elongatum DSM 19469]|uniref:Uncharacterized protein n=1 Tax=Roseicyclus elongatus DSM 19469 TaxID=1294273 RepID=W8RY09_9RHOB|nr:hypothetical protein roselon_00272 [Roseibacterium elongatum DSM 19469]